MFANVCISLTPWLKTTPVRPISAKTYPRSAKLRDLTHRAPAGLAATVASGCCDTASTRCTVDDDAVCIASHRCGSISRFAMARNRLLCEGRQRRYEKEDKRCESPALE
jgi:hypothetical protein